MSKPVFLFAFANDKDAYLENLKEEERVVREIFSRLHDQGVIEFLSIGSTNSEDIFRNVERFLDRLTLFHYGGHAAGTQLYLEDGIASSQGLSKLLGQAKSLQTVVLNGCSSRGQTEKLFQSGVKSVIATSAPIDDDKAVLFAKELYRSFSSGSTLEAAFEIAAAALQTHGKLKNKEISKKVGSAEELAKEEILWGLYSRTRSVLGWKLRDVPELKKSNVPSKPVNEYLMSRAFDEVNEYNPFSGGKISNPAQIKLKKREHLINSLPSVLGGQVSVLFTPELSKKSRERLKQIQTVYFRFMVFFSSVLISDLWDRIVENPELEIPNETRFLVSSFIESGKEEHLVFPFFDLISVCIQIFETQSLNLFMDEFSLLRKDGKFIPEIQAVSDFFSGLMKSDLGKLSAEDIEIYNNEAEHYLSEFIALTAFVTGYFISSNKRIHIQKIRFQKGIFRHEMRVMYGNDYAEDEEMGSRTELLDSYSVYLVKERDEEKVFLNLTPFLIDRNSIFDIVTPDLVQFYYSENERTFYDHITENSLNSEFEISHIYAEKISEEEQTAKLLVNEFENLLELFRKHIGGEK